MPTRMDFVDLALFFPIPLFVLAGSWAMQLEWRARLSAACDLFVFLLSFDISMLAWYAAGITRVNPLFSDIYRPLFGILAAFSVLCLAYSNRVQSKIYGHIRGEIRYFPA